MKLETCDCTTGTFPLFPLKVHQCRFENLSMCCFHLKAILTFLIREICRINRGACTTFKK